jgi:hypothetical protein
MGARLSTDTQPALWDDSPPELGNEYDLTEFDDYWLSWDTLTEQTSPDA